MRLLAVTSFFTLCSLIALNASAAEKAVFTPESLAAVGSTHAFGDQVFSFCPTDVYYRDWTNQDSVKLGAVSAAGACIAITGGLCAPVAFAVALLGTLPEFLNDAPLSQADLEAQKTCYSIPNTIAPADRPYWQQVCKTVVAAANRDALLNAKDGWAPKALPPYQLRDPVLSWTLNGDPVQRVEALRYAERRLRDSFMTACFSDSSFLSELGSSHEITLSELIDLTFNNIKQYGSHFYKVPSMEPVFSSWFGPTQSPASDAKRFVCAYEDGALDQFQDPYNQPSGDVWANVIFEDLDELHKKPWMTNQDLYRLAKKSAPVCQ